MNWVARNASDIRRNIATVPPRYLSRAGGRRVAAGVAWRWGREYATGV